jgi:hypothetical protein
LLFLTKRSKLRRAAAVFAGVVTLCLGNWAIAGPIPSYPPATAPLSGAELTICNQNGVTVGCTAAQIGAVGTGNVPMGRGHDSSAVQSVAIDTGSLANATADQCLAIGWHALNLFTVGSSVPCGNTAVGQQALATTVTGQENTAVGQYAAANTTGSANTVVGQGAGQNAVFSQSEFYGWGSGYNAATSFDACYGYSSCYADTGGQNTAFGHDALINNTSGFNNVAVGFLAGESLVAQHGVVILGNSPTNASQPC